MKKDYKIGDKVKFIKSNDFGTVKNVISERNLKIEDSSGFLSIVNKSEVIPEIKFNNPLKNFYFKFIKKQDPYSIDAVKDLLKKFEKNVHLIKGNSNNILKKIDMAKVDFVFLDGGHHYETVKNDLTNCSDVLKNGGIVLNN